MLWIAHLICRHCCYCCAVVSSIWPVTGHNQAAPRARQHQSPLPQLWRTASGALVVQTSYNKQYYSWSWIMALFWILKQINTVSSVQCNPASPRVIYAVQARLGSGGQWLQWYIDTCPCLPLIVRLLLLLMPPFKSKMLWQECDTTRLYTKCNKFGITALPLFIGCLANICIFFNVV